MAEIKFDTGIVEYRLNDTVSVSFNPTDLSFIESIFSAFDALDAKQDEYSKRVSGETDGKTLFNVARQMNDEMREIIDTAFGKPICSDLFGTMHVYAAGDGLPAWCNLMLAVIDEMDSAFAREKAKTNPRIQKYVKKYNKK